MTSFFFKHQFILQNRYLFSPVSSGAGADGIAKRTETHWQRALPAKHQFIGLRGNRYLHRFLFENFMFKVCIISVKKSGVYSLFP